MTHPDTADEQTSGIYRDAGFTGSFRLGRRPAVLVVDFSRGFTDPDCPLGFDATVEVERTRAVLDAARDCGAPVVFTTIAYDEGGRAGSTWLRKVPSLGALVLGSPWVDIDERLGRLDGEPVVAKGGASAFFGTPVLALLVGRHVDTVFVLGATTSGCVRASVVDAVQHGFPTFVVQDCCADRSLGPHQANLFDMTAKYADGTTSEEVVRYLNGLPRTPAG